MTWITENLQQYICDVMVCFQSLKLKTARRCKTKDFQIQTANQTDVVMVHKLPDQTTNYMTIR